MFIPSIHYEELWGPWKTFTVAAILANATYWEGSIEFDKAAAVYASRHRQSGCHSFIRNRPGSESYGPVSSAQICAWVPPAAPLSSAHGQRKLVSRSSLSRSSRPQPAANKRNKPIQNKVVGVFQNSGCHPIPKRPANQPGSLSNQVEAWDSRSLVGKKTRRDFGLRRTGLMTPS